MQSVAVNILFGFVAQARANELAANRILDVLGSRDKLAYDRSQHYAPMDGSIGMMVDDLVDHLFETAAQSSPIHYADLSNPVFGKPGYLTVPPRQLPLHSVRPAAAASASGLGVRFPMGKRPGSHAPSMSMSDEAMWRQLPEEVKRQVAASPQKQVHAMCDRRSRSCRLTVTKAARTHAPVVQQAQCVAPALYAEEMPKQYSPANFEQRLYEWWESSGYFQPTDDSEKQCFVISMPPPNVTGKLHMGHAMFVALQDIMARFHRMRGYPTLWLPGTDHAGIATQMLVEKALRAEGTERKEIGRDAFLEKVWDWKEMYGGFITDQIRRLGASCDWSREKFTLQPSMCEAVTEAFVSLHERGLIYRGEYMVNWSPSLGTAISDLEVEYAEEEGSLYYFKYRVADSENDEYVPVATTRPETILGDEAVCVHPEDERYKHLIGKEVLVPILDRRVPVIADDYVQMDFGSGALKVTPAHDVNDYAIGKRHSLPMRNILNKDATINDEGGQYTGLDRYACREQLWADMSDVGLTIKVEKHTQRVPRSQRSGEVIEPMISSQWFVKMDGMAKKALDAVRNGDIKIIPQRFEKTYFQWLENIQDWCVSRQLWWGHRIPVWYAEGHKGKFYVARNAEEAQKQAEAELGAGVVLTQDEDVLDTWFSSGLWPFATVGWPTPMGAALEDYNRFYPSSVMETGYDILFFWVARMVMLGLEFTGKAPFHTIYMHGLVRDSKGQKMSKTKGNVIDPLETIKEYGTDALRLSLVTGVTPGQDVNLAMDKVLANRNFANKLWNTGRFIVLGLEGLSQEEQSGLVVRQPMTVDEIEKLPLPERWVISRCHQLIGSVTTQLSTYDFGPAGQSIYQFLWDEYAVWYLEISKVRINGDDSAAAFAARRTLVYILDSCLRLLHPFMPFVTEEIWQRLPHEGASLMNAAWPQKDDVELPVDKTAIAQFDSFQSLIRSIRNARAEYRVNPGKEIAATILASGEVFEKLEEESNSFASLARIDPKLLDFALWNSEAGAPDDDSMVRLVAGDELEAKLPLAELIDAGKERKRLGKQQKQLEKSIAQLTGRLESSGFADKAPPALVEKTKAELADQAEKLKVVLSALDKLPT